MMKRDISFLLSILSTPAQITGESIGQQEQVHG